MESMLVNNLYLKRFTPANYFSGGGIIVDKHGARRAPFRFSIGRFSCFR